MKEKIISDAITYIKNVFSNDTTGHDFYHSLRVYKTATYIAEKEDANLFIVQLSALLHDVDDYKLEFGNSELKNTRSFLGANNMSKTEIDIICDIISQVSFKGISSYVPSTLEGKIVQDADRLDSIGAIGIARTFAYGGSIGRAIYLPEIKPKKFTNMDEYKYYVGTTINHFYEKLLQIKSGMNTEEGKKLALQRHVFMEEFLKEFFCEWDCKNELSKKIF